MTANALLQDKCAHKVTFKKPESGLKLTVLKALFDQMVCQVRGWSNGHANVLDSLVEQICRQYEAKLEATVCQFNDYIIESKQVIS